MKAWVKVVLGLVAGAAIGAGAAFLGKHQADEAEYVTTEVEAEDYDSDSDEEAE